MKDVDFTITEVSKELGYERGPRMPPPMAIEGL